MVLQITFRVSVRGSGPGCRLAEAVAGLPGPAPPCVGEVGFELAALGLELAAVDLELAALGLDIGVGPVFPEQLADGGGTAPQGAYCGASEAARERCAFGPVTASQLDALTGTVGAQLADRRTAGPEGAGPPSACGSARAAC